MRPVPAFLALSLALAAPAMAQPVTIEDVRAMAFDKGIVRIEEVELDDGVWEVEGIDASGPGNRDEDRGRERSDHQAQARLANPASIASIRAPGGCRDNHLSFAAGEAYINSCRREPDMAINSLRNKPFGPGGGTRRLHHQGAEVSGEKSAEPLISNN